MTSVPDSELGPALVRRSSPSWACVALAAICAVPVTSWVLSTATRPAELGPVGAVALWLTLVALPSWAAWVLWAQRIHVSDEAVTAVGLRGLVRQVRWEEVTAVVVGLELTRRPFAMTRHDVVGLVATDAQGRRRGLRVSGMFVKDLRPLVARTAIEVTRRPGLVDAARRPVFDDLVGRLLLR